MKELQYYKKKAVDAKDVEEFFAVFEECAEDCGLDLKEYSKELSQRLK